MDALIIVIVSTVVIIFAAEKAFGVDHTVKGWDLTAVNVSSVTRSKLVFSVGDELVFKMDEGEADIAQVSKPDYELCSSEAPKAIYRASPREAIYLNKTGNWYFISRVPEHCKSGKKMTVTVVATSSNKSNGKLGLRFREAFQRMTMSHKGGGGGGGSSGGGGGSSGGGGGGSTGSGTPANGGSGTADPLGNRNRVLPKKSGSSSTQELSAMAFKFQIVMSLFCSVLLGSPLFV